MDDTKQPLEIDIGADGRPWIFEPYDWRCGWYERNPVQWDGRGVIDVRGACFRSFLHVPDVGDSFELCGHRLLVIERNWVSMTHVCMTETPAAHRAAIFRMLYYQDLQVWHRLMRAKYPPVQMPAD